MTYEEALREIIDVVDPLDPIDDSTVIATSDDVRKTNIDHYTALWFGSHFINQRPSELTHFTARLCASQSNISSADF